MTPYFTSRNLTSSQVTELRYAMTLSYYPAHIISSTFFFISGLLLVLFVLPFLKEKRGNPFWRTVEKEIFLPTTTFSIVSIFGFITYIGFYLSIIYYQITAIAVFGTLFGILDNGKLRNIDF